MNAAYHLENLGFAYGEREVLDVSRLEIPAGKVTALVGPNGSGKSTLLHVLSFLAEPRRGSLRFYGEEATAARVPALRLRVGLLLQNPYLFHASVAGNVDWGLKVRGMERLERQRRIGEALGLLGLAGYEDRFAHALSGGESQRLALARLLALEPDVILLDEPTNHLDAETRVRVEHALQDWVGRRGTTVVLATHDVAQAYRLGAAVWQMEDGRIREGEPDNVFRGRPVTGEPGVFETARLRLRVHPPPEGAVCLRIGPQEVLLSREPPSTSALNCLRGTVVRAELAGPGEIRATIDCGEPLVAVVTQESWNRLGLTVGQEAVASFKATAVRPC
ncbi:MAG: ABC transporter ATP-binding protein [Deferrisomatales bacterium]|nr:ABC transporter ATP-binding protein [Deferrisomatales bacterium]